MKKIFVTLVCLGLCSTAVFAQDQKKKEATAAAPTKTATVQFLKETHDFGEVPEGPEAEYEFEFMNNGKEPVIITGARASCGCTVPSWSKDPVLPGKKGSVSVKYNTAGRPGAIQKEVYVTTNVQPDPIILHLRGTVKAKAMETSGSTK